MARAYRIMGELDAMVADVGALREAVAGNARVGILGTTARWLVPMLLAELSQSHPRLHLVVADGTTLGLEPQLAAGRLDLAVLTFPVPGRDLVSEPLFEEDIVLVVPVDDDPLSGVERIDLADLERFELLLPGAGHAVSRRDRRRGETGRCAAATPGRARRRPPPGLAHLRGLRARRAARHRRPTPSAPPLPARSRWTACSPGGSGIAQRSRGLPSAPARAVLDTLRELMDRPDRLPPGVHSVVGNQRTRAEGRCGPWGCPTAEGRHGWDTREPGTQRAR